MNGLVVFWMPDLAKRPVLGGGCCAVTSAWLIEDALAQLPGVQEVRADDEHGTVHVTFDSERVSLERIAAELEALGFPPARATSPEEERVCTKGALP